MRSTKPSLDRTGGRFTPGLPGGWEGEKVEEGTLIIPEVVDSVAAKAAAAPTRALAETRPTLDASADPPRPVPGCLLRSWRASCGVWRCCGCAGVAVCCLEWPGVAACCCEDEEVAVEGRVLDLERFWRRVPPTDGTPLRVAADGSFAAANGASFLVVEAGAEEDFVTLNLSAACSAIRSS